MCGEPTYNPNTISLIEQIITVVPKPNIVVTSNGNTKKKLMDRYIKAIQKYPHVQWTFDYSMDGTQEVAEAIRHGVNWKQFITNANRIFKESNAKLRIAPTINMYSVPTMKEYVKYFHEMFMEHDRARSDMFTYNLVLETELSVTSMPKKYGEWLDPAIEYCHEHGLSLENHLKDVRKLVGSKIDGWTYVPVEEKWEYFKKRRPENEMG